MQNITIRTAQQSDIEDLVALLYLLFSIEADFIFNENLQRRGLQLMLDNDLGCIMVAQANEGVVGMCSGQLTVSTAEGGPALLVEDVVVNPKWQGQGLGRRLMDQLSAWAKNKGVSRLQLLADRNNKTALDFYAKLGWQTTELICLRKRLSP